jgi:predicted dehydrogenase
LSAVVIATPDHWHASLAIAALQARQDVYLEAPCAHRPEELARITAAARDSGGIVQCGLQHRSCGWVQTAVELIQRGELGAVRHVRAWMTCRRKPVGRRADAPSPAGVDYAAWLGPAPARPFNPNRFHGSWTRFWDYGGGELGLWGIHWLDVAGWALAPAGPLTVHAVGQRLHFVDDQETPDTLFVHYVFAGSRPLHLTWEHRSWTPHAPEGRTSGLAFYGEQGTLVLDRGGWKIYDRPTPLAAPGGGLDAPHLDDFLDCVRTRRPPRASLPVAAGSHELYHLGVQAFREQRVLTVPAFSFVGPEPPASSRVGSADG